MTNGLNFTFPLTQLEEIVIKVPLQYVSTNNYIKVGQMGHLRETRYNLVLHSSLLHLSSGTLLVIKD